MPDTTHGTDAQHGRGWLEPSGSATVHTLDTGTTEQSGQQPDDRWKWITPPATVESHPDVPRRVWIGLAAGFAAAATLAGLGTQSINRNDDNTVPAATRLAGPPTSSPTTPASATSEAPGACEGLTGATVTAADGDRATLPGAIAAFEFAYYARRDAHTAMAVVAPEAGLQVEVLAAGIASIPHGTTHCVAITPIAVTTAEVHLVELGPDGHRTDYLQVINTRLLDGTALITNIQKRG
ncbi:hypothetical protein [Nocardia cyriacigeorgica]|uniref:hypothetical protein n=1 Tax=Nocardia cyriacigeorgica TaxID=135487 RepID=UPI0018942EA1|nr:hypothetical protein [Nocardia cyriacigeorgica]MBF6325886.1 hypothetical protein [Nocardia cyriacigeorgica]